VGGGGVRRGRTGARGFVKRVNEAKNFVQEEEELTYETSCRASADAEVTVTKEL